MLPGEQGQQSLSPYSLFYPEPLISYLEFLSSKKKNQFIESENTGNFSQKLLDRRFMYSIIIELVYSTILLIYINELFFLLVFYIVEELIIIISIDMHTQAVSNNFLS